MHDVACLIKLLIKICSPYQYHTKKKKIKLSVVCVDYSFIKFRDVVTCFVERIDWPGF